jgi:hypothetical protein
MTDRDHGHRIDHLLMKLRIGFRRFQTVLAKDARVIQIHRIVKNAARRVGIHHFDVLPDGTGLQMLLPGDFNGDLPDPHRLELRGQAGVE